MAADENYGMPLAACLVSIGDSNYSGNTEIHILYDRFAMSLRQRVEASTTARIIWHGVDLSKFAHCGTLSHVSAVTYARLAIAELFDDSVGRVLYLDADTLVLGPLKPLFDMPLDGYSHCSSAKNGDGAGLGEAVALLNGKAPMSGPVVSVCTTVPSDKE